MYQEIKGCSVLPGYYTLGHTNYAFTPKDKLEAVQLSFDEAIVSLREIFEVFFISHNPTLVAWDKANCVSPLNRSSIVVNNETDKKSALSYIDSQRPLYSEPLQTKILLDPDSSTHFTLAPEKEHNYYKNNPTDGYSTSLIEPRILKLKEQVPHLLKK